MQFWNEFSNDTLQNHLQFVLQLVYRICEMDLHFWWKAPNLAYKGF